MKYIITESQYNLINEALGVPESILEAAEEVYGMILNDLKSIRQKKDEYEFYGDIDITLGYKQKIYLDSYKLIVEVNEIDEFKEHPKIASMGMSQTFRFDRDIKLKTIKPSSKATFTLTYIVNSEWEPQQLAQEFESDRDEYIGSIAHELKHKYDKQVSRKGLIGHDAEYNAIGDMPPFRIDVLDEKFIHFLYFTTVAENLVRPSEVASNIRTKNITKSQFLDFLKKDKTFQKLQEIKNFTYEDLVSGIKDNMERVDFFISEIMEEDPTTMTDDEKVEKVLRLFFINLSNRKLEKFSRYVDGPMGSDPLLSMLASMLGQSLGDSEELDKIKENFQKFVLRFENNPIKFFKYEIKKFNMIADKMIRKIAKLYDMAKDDGQTNESIINWELHRLLMEKKYGPFKIHKEIIYKKK